MAKRHDVMIFTRHISLDVVIPERYAWEFMAEFGTAFGVYDAPGLRRIKAVKGYYNHPAGWHIQIDVGENDEDRFHEFLRDFCSARGLSLLQEKQSVA